MESQFQITVAPKGKGRKFLLLRKRSLEKTPNRVTSVLTLADTGFFSDC